VTAKAQAWLPDTAFAEPALVARIDDAIAAWSGRWFADRAIKRLGAAKPCKSGIKAANAQRTLQCFAPFVWIEWSGQIGMALARQALALGQAQPKSNAVDDRLLNFYAERIAGDLAEAIAALLGIKGESAKSDPAAMGPCLEIRLRGAGDSPALQVLIENSALVGLRKKLCSAWQPPRSKHAPLSRALAPATIEFTVSLGGTRMSALDLRNIAPGDIIVMERAMTDPVLLRSREADTVIGGARLVRDRDSFILEAS
jgi:flagellar motor switch/type III secretory pathway protein FliN